MGLMIGITGGIGAGKSLVSSLFSLLQVPIYEADSRAKILMQSDERLKSQITEVLGTKSYNLDGELDRNYVAQQVFSDRFLLAKINGLVHPCVADEYKTWHARQTYPYTLEEAALLYESGAYLHMDAVIHVQSSENLRIKRVMERDAVNREQVIARMQNQWPDERRRMMADFTIINDGTQALIPQVFSLHQMLKNEVQTV